MNKEDIQAFIIENRAIAETQAQRWQGVDPSRLLAALTLIEELAAGASLGAALPFRLDSMNMSMSELNPHQYEIALELHAYLNREGAEAIHGYIKSHHTVMVRLSDKEGF